MSKNPLLDYLKSDEFNNPTQSFNQGGYAKAGYADGGYVVDTSEDPNEDYSHEGINYPPETNNEDYSHEGNNAPPAGAVSTTPDGKSWLDRFGNIIGPVVATLVTPWLNNLQSGGQLSEGRDMLRRGATAYDNVAITDLNTLIPQLQRQVQQGTMTAAQATAALQQASAMNSVQTDAQSLAAQRAGLSRLNDIATNAGMTDADRAQLAETMNQTNANAASQRAAALQALQMQGNAGTGAELATRLSGAQSAAGANAMAGANVATSAQARALQALQANIQGNANLNQTQWGQQADRAKANDAVNQFNASAQNQIAMGNQAAQQQANLTNFNTANSINANNTNIANQQAMLPLNVGQQQNQTNLQRAAGQASANVNAGRAMIGQGNIQATNTAGATSAASSPSSGSSGGTNWGGIIDAGTKLWDWFSDEDLKCDKKEMSDDEVDKMLGDLTAYKYRYRGNNGQNPQTQGVLAQDIEKTSMKNGVIDTPAGKMVSGNDVMGKALAALANMNERVRKMEGK